MKHVMLDIETMGKKITAPIISIGACYFDPKTGGIGKTFHMQIDMETNGTPEPSTIIWWMKQDDEARSKFFDNDKANNIYSVLNALGGFIHEDARVWGNGIAFDNVKVINAYESCGLDVPWEFWNDRDVRTIVEIGLEIGINPKEDVKFEGVKHDALADAIHQAKYVSEIYSTLTGE